jgi:hypothetical protein
VGVVGAHVGPVALGSTLKPASGGAFGGLKGVGTGDGLGGQSRWLLLDYFRHMKAGNGVGGGGGGGSKGMTQQAAAVHGQAQGCGGGGGGNGSSPAPATRLAVPKLDLTKLAIQKLEVRGFRAGRIVSVGDGDERRICSLVACNRQPCNAFVLHANG